MTRKQKTVSYSQYSLHKTCPYLWYSQYAKGLYQFKPSIHLVFGTSLHETLQLWLKVMYTQSGSAADKMDLELDFKQRLLQEYKKRVQENNNEHFSSKEELHEFYLDGIAILDWVKKKRNRYFSLRNVELVGIEIPVKTQANRGIENVVLKGAIDFILYDKTLNRYSIYDIKTSTRGWTDQDKKDDKKINQVLLYKKFFSEIQQVPEEDVDVTFFIVKRKVPEIKDFPIYRVQEFKPAHGKTKVKKAYEDFQSFITECFTPEGQYVEKNYYKNVGDSCKFCPFNDRPDICDKKNVG
jgi:hypothetical protein